MIDYLVTCVCMYVYIYIYLSILISLSLYIYIYIQRAAELRTLHRAYFSVFTFCFLDIENSGFLNIEI